jgi:hypothetical protein
LVLLSAYGNFIPDTLGCQSQKFLTNNILVKQFIIIMIIYFSINFTSSENTNPNVVLLNTFYIWIGFVIFNKMTLNFQIIVFLLLMSVYIIYNYNEYYKKQKNIVEEHRIKTLDTIKSVIYVIILGITLIGFISFSINHYIKYKDNWDTIKYLFATAECSNLV